MVSHFFTSKSDELFWSSPSKAVTVSSHRSRPTLPSPLPGEVKVNKNRAIFCATLYNEGCDLTFSCILQISGNVVSTYLQDVAIVGGSVRPVAWWLQAYNDGPWSSQVTDIGRAVGAIYEPTWPSGRVRRRPVRSARVR